MVDWGLPGCRLFLWGLRFYDGSKESEANKGKENTRKLLCWYSSLMFAFSLFSLASWWDCFVLTSLHFPAEYKCHQTNTTLTSLNQRPVNITCSDLRYKEKSKLNIAIIGIMAFSIVLCLLTLIHLAVTRKAFLEQLLGDIFEREDGNAAGLNLIVGELRARCW